MALTGRTALLAVLGSLPVYASGSGWTIFAVEAALAVGVLIDLVLAGSVSALRFERAGATSVRLNESVAVTLGVANLGRRRVRGKLRDAWEPSAGAELTPDQISLAPGARAMLVLTLKPTRRGDRRPDRVTIRSTGPLGLAARQGAARVPWTLRVLPTFAARRHLPVRLERLRVLDGRNAARIRGAGTEFDSLREYVIGDDVRSIDWRAAARRTELTVRTWRPERDRRVIVVLDTGRTSAGRVGDAPRLDAAMDAALLLAAIAARAGDRVDLLAYDRRVRAAVSGAPANRLLSELVNAMAPLEPALLETDMPGLVAEVRRRSARDALVVLLSSLDEAPVSAGLLPVLPVLLARHRVVLASVADPRVVEMTAGRGSAETVYAAAAAERTRSVRARNAALLTRRGVAVVDAPPEELPPALADTYLALKAAGRL